MSRQLSIRDWELLSAFLDGQLDAKSTQQVEQAISVRPEMKQALQELRHNKSLFKQIPLQRVRRNFTLKPGMLPARSIPRFVPFFRTLSAVVAAIAVVLFAIDLLPGFAPLAAAPKASSLAVSENPAPGSSSPEVIFWNGQQNFITNSGTLAPSGLGGGYGGGGGGIIGGGAPSIVQPATSNLALTPTPVPFEPPLVAVPPIEKNPLSLSPTPTPPAVAITQATPGAADTTTRNLAEGPILGIPPTQDQGKVITSESGIAPASSSTSPLPFLRIVGAILLVLAVTTGIWAWSVPRKR